MNWPYTSKQTRQYHFHHQQRYNATSSTQANPTMLTPEHCDLFCQPFFQFSQLKQYCPERIEPLKAAYKSAWQDWRTTVLAVAQHAQAQQPNRFAAPHIERWCNGWQVRAHFFAYFKYAECDHSAAILSLILNRKRLTVSLDWHAYRAHHSTHSLADYHQWLDGLDEQSLGDCTIWRGSDGEYGEGFTLADFQNGSLPLSNESDFYRIGKHLPRAELAQVDSVAFIWKTMTQLLPLYERIHGSSSGGL